MSNARDRGRPTVLLEAGLRSRGDIWSIQLDDPMQMPVESGVAGFTHVCAYDRPGTTLGVGDFSRSDPVTQPRTATDAVADLAALLRATGIPGPYVLVGHSTGGLIVRLFASLHPDAVSGMVQVDAISEEVRRAMQLADWAIYDRELLTKAPPPVEGYKDFEYIQLDASFEQMEQAKAAQPLRPIPLAVVSKGLPFDLPDTTALPTGFVAKVENAWQAGQAFLAGLVPDSRHIVAPRSSH